MKRGRKGRVTGAGGRPRRREGPREGKEARRKRKRALWTWEWERSHSLHRESDAWKQDGALLSSSTFSDIHPSSFSRSLSAIFFRFCYTPFPSFFLLILSPWPVHPLLAESSAAMRRGISLGNGEGDAHRRRKRDARFNACVNCAREYP